MEKYAKKLPLGLFGITIAKMLIFGATWEGAALAAVVGILAAAYEYKNHDNQIKAFEARLEQIIDATNAQAKVIEELRLSLSSVRLTQQAKTISSQPAKTELQRIF